MMRFAFPAALATLSLVLAGGASAQSETKKPAPAKKAAAPAASSSAGGPPRGATLVDTFGDWSAYTATNGRSKICFAQSEPKSRSPANLKDTKAYLFVSFRPADNIRNEVAAVLNFKTRESGPAALAIGQTNYELITKGENAWVKSPADEAAAVAAMAKGETMILSTTSARGNKTADRYSLSGFSQALERAKRDCP